MAFLKLHGGYYGTKSMISPSVYLLFKSMKNHLRVWTTSSMLLTLKGAMTYLCDPDLRRRSCLFVHGEKHC